MRLKHPYNIVTFLVGFALFMLLVAISGCTVYKVPKPNITHVLAITAEGDTLKLPIDVIRPIYNYNNVTYPRTNYYPYHNYYYKPHNNINNWKPIGGGNSNNNNNNNNNTTPVTPTVKPSGNVATPPVPVNPRKN
tara:strand:- start:29 stop:433 length:405 start_codon:yes stop_codon:yes gene_type:complete